MLYRTWQTEMTASERRRGAVLFLLYLLVLPWINAWVQRIWMGEREVLVAEANVVYYAFLFLLCLFTFGGFLWKDLGRLMDWLPENLFALVIGLLIGGGFQLAIRYLPLPVGDPISAQYAQEYLAAPLPTLALVLVLIPVVEETLYRGLVFGSLRSYSRPLGFVLTAVGYALALVWQYAWETRQPSYLLLAIPYLPMSLVLTWCYDRGGSVWSCALLHGGLNGLGLFARLAL